MLNYKKIFIILYFLLIPLNLMPSESHTSIPGEVFAYLKTKEVPKELKEKLDKIFYSEKVIKGLEIIYNHSENNIESQHGRTLLVAEGFEFFQCSNRVFRHKSIPEFIFKISGISDFPSQPTFRSELKNAGRIRFAELLNERGENIIRAPKKYAYMPYIYRTEYISLPICIVVAKFVKKDDLIDSLLKPISLLFSDKKRVNIREAYDILHSLNMTDRHSGNIYHFLTFCMVIDTEPHYEKLEYPKLPLRAKL
ncbi:MAG: hypothetical protein P4L22_04920 [Candidatus Babeliales bacterium]|nr:hypothetical protein [Candidatus Babeliales bacterium]